MCWRQGLLVLAGVLLVKVTAISDNCTPVNHQELSCASDSTGNITVSMSCPEKYIMKIRTTEYRISNSTTCPSTEDGGSCLIHTAFDELWALCHTKPACNVSVPRETNSANCVLEGIHYVAVVLSCEPLFFYNQDRAAVTLLNRNDTRTDNHLVYVQSQSTVVKGTSEHNDTTQGCVIHLSPHTQLFIQVPIFTKVPPPRRAQQCNQRLEVYDTAGYRTVFCDRNVVDFSTAGCGHSSHTLFLRYINTEPAVQVGFVVSLAVSHMSTAFNITCGESVLSLPEFSLALPDNSTQLPVVAADADVDDYEFIVMLTCITVALLIMVAVISFLIFRYRSDVRNQKSSEPQRSQEPTEGEANYAYIGDVYLDGDSTLKLVRDKKRAFSQTNTLSSRI